MGFSGGVDSTVLLHLLCDYLQDVAHRGEQRLPTLRALHVNHSLSPHAQQWEKHCSKWCSARAVPLVIERVAVHRKPRSSLEANARAERYRAFARHVARQDCLFLAHHGDDQLETFLLRLNRGTGVLGLSAMASERELGSARLLRPLLHWERQQVLEYARAHQLEWIEDESNQNLDLNRNYLRHTIFPLLQERWPGYRQTWQRTIALMRESHELNEELAQLDWQLNDSPKLQRKYLQNISAARCANLLRYRLRMLDIAPPNEARLREFVRQLHQSSESATPSLEWSAGKMQSKSGVISISVQTQSG